MEGQTRKTTWQVAKVRRPLMSVTKMTESGNEVKLSRDDPHILNLKTGQRTALRKEGNVYVLDLWVEIPAPPGMTMQSRNRSRTGATPFGRQAP